MGRIHGSQASKDLEGSPPKSHFILPSGEHVPHFLLFTLATLPRSDWIIVQSIIDAEQHPKLQAVLSRHTFTAFVADSEHLCDYLLAPPLSSGKHHTADHRIQEVSLRPKTRSFASYKSAGGNTANSTTRDGDILVLEGFEHSIKTASNVGKGPSISPSGSSGAVIYPFTYSVPNPEHPQPRTRDQP